MYNYLVIFQANSLETRNVHPIECKQEDLLQEVIKTIGYDGCTSIIEMSECARDADWSITVIDLKTYEIVE